MPLTPTERRKITAILNTPNTITRWYIIKQRSKFCGTDTHKAGYITTTAGECSKCKWTVQNNSVSATQVSDQYRAEAREYAQRMSLAASKGADLDTATEERIDTLAEHAAYEADNVATYVTVKERKPLTNGKVLKVAVDAEGHSGVVNTGRVVKADYQDYDTNAEATAPRLTPWDFRVDGSTGFVEQQINTYDRPLNTYWIVRKSEDTNNPTAECKYCHKHFARSDHDTIPYSTEYNNQSALIEQIVHYYECGMLRQIMRKQARALQQQEEAFATYGPEFDYRPQTSHVAKDLDGNVLKARITYSAPLAHAA